MKTFTFDEGLEVTGDLAEYLFEIEDEGEGQEAWKELVNLAEQGLKAKIRTREYGKKEREKIKALKEWAKSQGKIV